MASETVMKSEAFDTPPQAVFDGESLNDCGDVHDSTAPRPTPSPKPWLNLKRKFDLDADVLLCRLCTELPRCSYIHASTSLIFNAVQV
jgi:hypothetical protein